MILKYMLPKSLESQISLSGDERIYYAVPIDIDDSGRWTENSFFVVTTKKVYILRESDTKVYDIKDMKSAKAEPGVGGGIITVKHQGVEKVLAHYSAKHLGRYAYIADYRGESCGDMDIYKVTFHDVAAPYSVFKGVISDIDSTELLQTISQYKAVIRDAGSKNIIGNYRPEPHDGRFTFILQPGLYLIDLYANETEASRTRLTVADREPAEKCPIIELKKQP